jgi:hypothetical protein
VSVPRYAPGSHFESCPATTGETLIERECQGYPDGAHRCRHDRRPLHHRHECLCAYAWICLDASALDDPQITALLHPARHAA